ncbi:unnamed protein product, partial [marine sediment metagenome]
QEEFSQVKRTNEEKPKIGIVGEFYVRLHEPANQRIIRKLEKKGAEVWLAPATEYLVYSYHLGSVIAREKFSLNRKKEDLKEWLLKSILYRVMIGYEHRLFKATLPYMQGFDDIPAKEIVSNGEKFINISQGVVVGFEMNNACAAGTGALLEKYAMRRDIKIEDFGDIALRAKKPPDIDSTCAVLSEQSIIKYEQNNVSLEDLCAALTLATARNYLAKVVRGKEIKEKVVFQGATAFNLGQVAALETVLERGIVVPPWPHITGAIGAA